LRGHPQALRGHAKSIIVNNQTTRMKSFDEVTDSLPFEVFGSLARDGDGAGGVESCNASENRRFPGLPYEK